MIELKPQPNSPLTIVYPDNSKDVLYADPRDLRVLAQVLFKSRRGYTLIESVIKYDPAEVLGIISSGVCRNTADPLCFTALHYACYFGNVNIVEALLSTGCDLNLCSNQSNFSPLHLAVHRGYLD